MKRQERIDRIELMRTFIRIVEAGSLSSAARQLDTTQATVSRRLQSLESMLGNRHNQLQLSRPADRQDILRYVQKEQYHIPYLALMIPALSP